MARSDLRLEDNGQLARVQRELRRFGDKTTRRKYYAGLNRATKPMRANAKAEALRILPKRGGLNVRVATKPKLTTRSNRDGVYVTSVGRTQARLIDRGVVRHPVFGNRAVWRTTSVPRGWFTKPMEAGAPRARSELVAVFNEVARDIAQRTTD